MTLDVPMYVVLYREGDSDINAIAVCLTAQNAEQYLQREGYIKTIHANEASPWYRRERSDGEPELAIICCVPYFGEVADLVIRNYA